MEQFKAKRKTETEIVLEDSSDLDTCMDLILAEDTFILVYPDKEKIISECVSGQLLRPKIKDGSIKLLSEEKVNKQ